MSWRAILRLLAAAALLAVCLPLWAVARLFGRGPAVVRRFLSGIGWLLGLRVARTGRPIGAPALYAANHISWLDILALGGSAEVRFVAKAQIARWPLVGWLARVADTVFVDRDRRGGARDQADAVAAALASGATVVLFAEGGTGDGATVSPFRAPLFASARAARAPVQPVAIDYGPDRRRHAWPDGTGFGREARRLLERRGQVPVTLRFLPPLDPALDRKALATLAREAVIGALT